jgi:hypothetical protein
MVSNVSEELHAYTLSEEVKKAVSVHSYTMLTTYMTHLDDLTINFHSR